MKPIHDLKVHMIPLDKIKVLNERRRGKIRFNEIVTSIANIGLKRPTIGSERKQKDGSVMYHTACGQGRYEGYKILGQKEIPMILIDADDETLLVMSLVENLARRNRTTLEMAREIQAMRERGYKNAEIARKVDLDVSYVNAMLRLLRQGEERLIVAVEHRTLPLSVALAIAESSDAEVQQAMREAYDKGDLRGKALLKARQLIETRQARGKKSRGGPRTSAPVTAETLLQEYRKDAARQQLLIGKARECQGRLGFITTALRKLLVDDAFVTLLRAEGLVTFPEYLSKHITLSGGAHAP
jgi:ParB family chromosome partitioning protein